jgi:hypothetical protein
MLAVSSKKRKTVQLNVLVARELRDKLTREAKRNGVSLNVEAAKRLGKSFAEDEMLGGEEGRRRLQSISNVFMLAGSTAAGGRKLSSWIGEPTAYSAGMYALIESVMIGQPDCTLDKCLLQIESLTGRVTRHFLHEEKTS